ncbi:type IV toxin-antitoxin system AbiEi family antitoxin [Rhodococcus sp. NPDC060176]|uniref:type IV toxin-antitoxin system AbiEi family antitoxin n=1 Tax=Rhodococcus sp. NPDC060176 TaxID=3347062 RepID=UPI00364746F7
MDPGLRDLAELLSEHFSSFGVELSILHGEKGPDSGFDAVAVLSRGNNSQHYALVLTAAMTATRITQLRQRVIGAPILVVGKRITERSATILRDQRIQYIDSLGNAYVQFGDVYIDVRGRRPDAQSSERRPVLLTHRITDESNLQLTHNLFSPRRSQVVFALLAWPQLATMKIREIARASGVSIGQAHDTLNLLEDTGFLPRNRPLSPHAASEILRPWAMEYPRGLRKKLTAARFYTDEPATFRPLHSRQEFFLSGESATGIDIQRPTALTVYIEHFEPKLAFANKWRKDPEQAPNVTVLQKFWTTPQIEHLDKEDRRRNGPHNAPWPLVYADLLATNDPRLSEVAETWREHCAGSKDL